MTSQEPCPPGHHTCGEPFVLQSFGDAERWNPPWGKDTTWCTAAHVPGRTDRGYIVRNGHVMMTGLSEAVRPEGETRQLCGVLHQKDLDPLTLPATMRRGATRHLHRVAGHFGVRAHKVVLIAMFQHVNETGTCE